MSTTIWKFPLGPNARRMLLIPVKSKILKVGMQDGEICMWAIVDPDAPIWEKEFRVVGTGWDLDESIFSWEYLDTVIDEDKGLVWHVFANQGMEPVER